MIIFLYDVVKRGDNVSFLRDPVMHKLAIVTTVLRESMKTDMRSAERNYFQLCYIPGYILPSVCAPVSH